MIDKVRLLHRLRGELGVMKYDLAKRQEEWELANCNRIAKKDILVIAVANVENELKAQRVAEYDGVDKSKVFGVAIREVTKLDYSDDAAYLWALSHQMSLRLDKKEFEKIAKATPLYFVTITTEPQATIAQDLSEYVKGE